MKEMKEKKVGIYIPDYAMRWVQERSRWNVIQRFAKKWEGFENNLQKIHTPRMLCEEMIWKLGEFTDFSGTFCCLNMEFVEVLAGKGVELARIWFVTDCREKAAMARIIWGGVNVVVGNFLEMKNMKFDVILGNPPYQSDSGNKGGKGHTLWDKFVVKSFELAKKDGFVCLIHPCGWRRISGSYVPVGKFIREHKLEYMEIHDINDGQSSFGVCTRYDWYIARNTTGEQSSTVVVSDDGETATIDINKRHFIPNGRFDEIYGLVADNETDKINMIFDCAYHMQKNYMAVEKNDEYQYPCIYSLPQKGIQLRFSSRNDRGHFGIPKLICSYGAAPQIIIDNDGEYGLTQWTFAIVDDVKVLPLIKKAMESKRFIELCRYMRFTLDKYDPNFLYNLKKDFWREFVDEQGNEIS